MTALSLDSMDHGAWPFFVDGVICLVNSVSVWKREEERQEKKQDEEEREREKMNKKREDGRENERQDEKEERR